MGRLKAYFNFGFKKKPLILILLCFFWLGYVALGTVQYVYELDRILENDNLVRFKRVDHEKYLDAPLLATLEVDTLIANLKKSVDARNFDFYILREDGKVISFFNPGYTIEEVEKWNFPKEQSIAKDGTVAWRRIDVRGYELVIGIQLHGSEFAMEVIKSMRRQIAIDFILVSLFFFGLIYFVLKDILDLTKVLQGKKERRPGQVHALSDEAKVLVSVASEYEKVSSSLKVSETVFSSSLSPAVRFELTQKTKAPHEFDALVVRVDVNGYTQLSLERKPEFVTKLLNQYFHRAAEVIQRFGGHIYQYVGDEIVLHFKVKDDAQGVARAVGCIRSLFSIAQELHEELKSEQVPFYVKASMAAGTLRFVNLDTGFAFSGIPLIESVRMLGGIDDKSANVLILTEAHFDLVKGEVGESKSISTFFKGFKSQKELIEIKAFKPFAPESNSPVESWTWHRSDQNLVAVIMWLNENLLRITRKDFLDVTSYLRNCLVQAPSEQLSRVFGDLYLVSTRMKRPSLEKELEDLMLASVTHLSTTFLRGAVLNDEVQKAMESQLQHSNARVKANTILALDELSPETYSFHEMFELPSNRAAADALIAEGRREYTEEVHQCLLNFVNSDNPFFVASGIYVLAYLYEFHARRDSVYLAGNARFKEIPEIVSRFKNAENFMVARRAAIAESQLSELSELRAA